MKRAHALRKAECSSQASSSTSLPTSRHCSVRFVVAVALSPARLSPPSPSILQCAFVSLVVVGTVPIGLKSSQRGETVRHYSRVVRRRVGRRRQSSAHRSSTMLTARTLARFGPRFAPSRGLATAPKAAKVCARQIWPVYHTPPPRQTCDDDESTDLSTERAAASGRALASRPC